MEECDECEEVVKKVYAKKGHGRDRFCWSCWNAFDGVIIEKEKTQEEYYVGKSTITSFEYVRPQEGAVNKDLIGAAVNKGVHVPIKNIIEALLQEYVSNKHLTIAKEGYDWVLINHKE